MALTTNTFPSTEPLIHERKESRAGLYGAVRLSLPLAIAAADPSAFSCTDVHLRVNRVAMNQPLAPLSASDALILDPPAPSVVVDAIYGSETYRSDYRADGELIGCESGGTGTNSGYIYNAYYIGVWGSGTPVVAPDRLRAVCDHVGAVERAVLRLSGRAPQYASIETVPSPSIPDNHVFIDNWGPVGRIEITAECWNLDTASAEPLNKFGGILRKRAINTLPQNLLLEDIVCGLLIKNNVAHYVQRGAVIRSTAIPVSPVAGHALHTRCTMAANIGYSSSSNTEWLGYDGIAAAVAEGDLPGGISDVTPTVQIVSGEAFVRRWPNGDSSPALVNGVFDVIYGGHLATMTSSGDLGAKSYSYGSGSSVPIAEIDLSDCAIVTSLGSTRTDDPDIGVVIQPDYDRESIQARTYEVAAPGAFWTSLIRTAETI